jgi:alpha-glucosidase
MRTPIPWQPPSVAGAGAGFTTGTPWLPVGASAEEVNVAVADRQPDSTLNLYRALIRARKGSRALREGRYRLLLCDKRVYVYERRLGDDVVIVAVNFSTDTVDLPIDHPETRSILVTSNKCASGSPDRLDPLEARWIVG